TAPVSPKTASKIRLEEIRFPLCIATGTDCPGSATGTIVKPVAAGAAGTWRAPGPHIPRPARVAGLGRPAGVQRYPGNPGAAVRPESHRRPGRDPDRAIAWR